MGPHVEAVVRIDTSVLYSFRNHGRYFPDFTIVRCILCLEASNVKNVWGITILHLPLFPYINPRS